MHATFRRSVTTQFCQYVCNTAAANSVMATRRTLLSFVAHTLQMIP
jgi:hypothetical protein